MTTNFKKTSDLATKGGLLSSERGGRWTASAISAMLAIGLLGLSALVAAQSNVRATKHNLSVSGAGPVKATSETQVCVFCHTPHAANTSAKTPLWNRGNSTTPQTYTRYTSSSLDANTITAGFSAQPGGSSMLCLSCHDGMIALGNVNVLPRNTGTPVGGPIAGLTGTMPVGSYGVNTGFTRNLGTDLSNDHPISINFTDALATADGELAQPSTNTTVLGIRSSGYKPLLPLEPTHITLAGQVQCATCHDPHITKDKFLRLNRFQAAQPTATFSQTNDQICLACHRKLGISWANSAHANTTNADYEYKTDASVVRGFPTGTPNKKVWEVACLNCHDTHTASGSRRLLREGTGGTPSATSAAFQAGSTVRPLENVSAIENTCYQCHNTPNTSGGADTVGATILKSTTLTATTGVPNIYTSFNTAGNIRMPIKTAEQTGGTTVETHDIRNANFIECRKTLGLTTALEVAGDHLTAAQKATCDALTGSNDNRHVECTDCHNPHRVIKNSQFNGQGDSTRRTHVPALTIAGTAPGGSGGNIASGALRGAWGVEPNFGVLGNPWPKPTGTYTVKKGDPGSNTTILKSDSYLTREYQLCLKCHSDYANGDTAASFPLLGNTGGGTPTASANGMTRYTNVAAEFGSVIATDPPTTGTDQGEQGGDTSIEPAGSYPVDISDTTALAGSQNHRSWHPVMWPTGRTRTERRIAATGGNFRAPFDTNVGTQTMHCSDCHGAGSTWTAGTGPILTTVQGPHGSANPFLLRGTWSSSTTIGSAGLCGNCHAPAASGSGFNNSGEEGGGGHANSHDGRACMFCHVAVPHGWKNKALLVNLRCVGTEGGQATECVNVTGNTYTFGPYYLNAALRVNTWRASGNWTIATCGGRDPMRAACGP